MTREPSPPNHAAYFAALSEQLHAEPTEALTIERICEQALELVPAAHHCGVTLRRRRGRLETVVASHDVVAACDALQLEVGEGPCLEPRQDLGAFLVRDTALDPRWPQWGAGAAQLGIRSLLSVQLIAPQRGDGSSVLGALNLYDARIGTFTRDDLDRALLFATHAASALAAAQKIDGLETAIHSRQLIGVAQGILMQRYGLSLDRSFEVMRRYSSETNIKLRDVAQMVVDSRDLPEPVTPTITNGHEPLTPA
ncbi:GAF and ANTAR domain-containing protein [Nocardioides sp. Bht2]|uniref:GAF and ANTAR domain-containing protein n=1 Tax=Nocardioides sp. Bht2 TaxID=3392297 RepID=UPI0039B6DAD4